MLHSIAGPFGPVKWDPSAARVKCRGTLARKHCPVMIPEGKPGGKCYGCELRNPRIKYRDDPELGRMRWCVGCAEWWPDDAEFWTMNGAGKTRCRVQANERKTKNTKGLYNSRRKA